MELKNYDIVLIGNYTEDDFLMNGEKKVRLGGPPSYMSSFLSAIGANYGVYSKVWPEFPFKGSLPFRPLPYRKKSKPLVCRLGETTGKTHIFRTSSEKILPKHIDFRSKISIISGVMGEVPLRTIKKVCKHSDITIGDTQMMLRRLDREGNVFLEYLSKTKYKKVIKSLDYLKVSEDEWRFLDVNLGDKPTILLTQGSKGSRIIKGDYEIPVPTTPLDETESNGAGDMFLAGFAYGRLMGYDEENAASIGNYCGGLAVESVGIPQITKEDIEDINAFMTSIKEGAVPSLCPEEGMDIYAESVPEV